MKSKMQRQDFVDNEIMGLVNLLVGKRRGLEVDWDAYHIGRIRDAIEVWVVDDLGCISHEEFYPMLED